MADKRSASSGFTLLELTFAVALFMVLLAAAAQSLISYYSALDIQAKRTVSTDHCCTVLSEMRERRDSSNDPFPGSIVGHWPQGEPVGGVATLRNEVVTVSYQDPTANPLVVTVQSQWRDLRGHQVTVAVDTALTDR